MPIFRLNSFRCIDFSGQSAADDDTQISGLVLKEIRNLEQSEIQSYIPRFFVVTQTGELMNWNGTKPPGTVYSHLNHFYCQILFNLSVGFPIILLEF